MQHAPEGCGPAACPIAPAHASCARCGARLATTKAGAVKRGIRFCREACRLDDVRERRAAARAELAKALHQIREQLDRTEDALAILGLHPSRRAKERAGWARTSKDRSGPR